MSAPWLVEAQFVPGPPKRFARAIEATVTSAAAIAYLGFGAIGLAKLLLMVIATGLESGLDCAWAV